eukprot:UN26696
MSLIVTSTVCFVAMLIFTGNLLVALFVCSCIVIVVCCVLGLFELVNWNFGPLEAVTVPTCIGLVIDYALHIGHSYMHSVHPERNERSYSAVKSIGLSVLAVALTTIFAMFTLAFCEVYIFAVIGAIIAAATTFGILVALVSLVALLTICGPEGKQCDLKWIYKRYCEKNRRGGRRWGGMPVYNNQNAYSQPPNEEDEPQNVD